MLVMTGLLFTQCNRNKGDIAPMRDYLILMTGRAYDDSLKVWAVDGRTGALKWTTPASGFTVDSRVLYTYDHLWSTVRSLADTVALFKQTFSFKNFRRTDPKNGSTLFSIRNIVRPDYLFLTQLDGFIMHYNHLLGVAGNTAIFHWDNRQNEVGNANLEDTFIYGTHLASGSMLWSRKVGDTSPMVVDGRLFLNALDKDKCREIDPGTGQTMREFQHSITANARQTNGLFFIQFANRLRAIDAQNGALKWESQFIDQLWDDAYTAANHQTAFIATANDLTAFDAATGKPAWKKEIAETGSVATGMTVVNDMLVISTRSKVLALKADNGELLWETRLGTNETAGEGWLRRLRTNGHIAYIQLPGSTIALNLRNGTEMWRIDHRNNLGAFYIASYEVFDSVELPF